VILFKEKDIGDTLSLTSVISKEKGADGLEPLALN
jgi:hypothetical protein